MLTVAMPPLTSPDLAEAEAEHGTPADHCNVTKLARFTYEPLDPEAHSVRFVKVLPQRSAGGYLQLKLWHSELPARYRCVSYVWGAENFQSDILLNGCLFSIRENLYAFLEQVHTWALTGFDEPIWIDAICINQSCVIERGHQVQRMGKIYAEALEVFMWLGDQGDDSDALFEWLHTAQSHQCPRHLRKQWDIVRSNPYWCRAWIKQEILLAKEVTVILRGASIEWTVLGRTIARSGDLTRWDKEHAAHLWSLWSERWLKRSGREKATIASRDGMFSFWSLMHTHMTSACTDRRDGVYSLLGLIEEEHSFIVDYKESAADMFWRVGEHFDAWQPDLVDVLRVALLEESIDSEQLQDKRTVVSPWSLAQSVRCKRDMQIRIPIRRVTSTGSFAQRFRSSVKCKLDSCKCAPRLQCTRDDLLICTNAPSDEPTQHGCIHAIAHPLDKPAAEPFEVKLVAHHREQLATTTLPSSAVQVYDRGTESWVGISTWSSLQKAIKQPDMDRFDRVKLSVPAPYAIWIWFGIHPGQLDEAYTSLDTELPSAHHALPSGTKIKKDSVELPAI